ncbi:hypothetical protein, partial [Ralstonia mannitolilytica]|uniref:hypothetical protein n=1 Tax=Ralstonia mannitolilytica TaxID=105219 RepID=UPI00292F4BC0
RLLPSDRRLPGHAGKAHPSQPLPSVIPLLHLVLDTAHDLPRICRGKTPTLRHIKNTSEK